MKMWPSSHSLPLSDILIAAIAIENDLSIYTLDNHFIQIPNLKLYEMWRLARFHGLYSLRPSPEIKRIDPVGFA
jgi:hypothetical protein